MRFTIGAVLDGRSGSVAPVQLPGRGRLPWWLGCR
jgi:hypothetical protein